MKPAVARKPAAASPRSPTAGALDRGEAGELAMHEPQNADQEARVVPAAVSSKHPSTPRVRARSCVSKPRLTKWYNGFLTKNAHRLSRPSRQETENAARAAFPAQQVDRGMLRAMRKELDPHRGKGGRPNAGGQKPGKENLAEKPGGQESGMEIPGKKEPGT